MKRTLSTLAILVGLTILVGGCDKVPPLSERIAKNWTARLVKEGSTVVYSKGAATNLKSGYSSFSLNLSSAPNVTLREHDGNTFTGSYELAGETGINLVSLTPQPTDSNGRLEYTIQSITDTELVLVAKFSYAKTGGTTNTYTLEAPL